MSRLARLFFNVTTMFCAHEWARRVDGRRVYLECVNCLSTTPGLDVGHAAKTTPPVARRRDLRTAPAA